MGDAHGSGETNPHISREHTEAGAIAYSCWQGWDGQETEVREMLAIVKTIQNEDANLRSGLQRLHDTLRDAGHIAYVGEANRGAHALLDKRTSAMAQRPTPHRPPFTTRLEIKSETNILSSVHDLPSTVDGRKTHVRRTGECE